MGDERRTDRPHDRLTRLGNFERWAMSEAALPKPSEVRTPELRGVAPGDPTFVSEVELVRADDYLEAVSDDREAFIAGFSAALEFCGAQEGISFGDRSDAERAWQKYRPAQRGGVVDDE